MMKEHTKEKVAKEEANYLNVTQKARFDELSGRDNLTAAEQRELEDLRTDSKVIPAPTVGYSREGDPTVFVPEGHPGKTKVKPYSGSLANTQTLSTSDFDSRFEIVGKE